MKKKPIKITDLSELSKIITLDQVVPDNHMTEYLIDKKISEMNIEELAEVIEDKKK